MTLQKSSHNFTAMFKESMRKACALPIILFGIFSVYSFANFIDMYLIKSGRRIDYSEVKATAYFMDGFCTGDGSFLLNAFIIFAAVLTAIILFNFQWSKKQNNVIYSLGMSRTEIFNSRILGGLVPMIGAVVTSSIFEVLANVFLGNTLNAHFWAMAAFMTLRVIAVYVLAFILCAVVFSNCGNIAEALIYTAILSVFTMFFEEFLSSTMSAYTLGAGSCGMGSDWNWNAPFFMSDIEVMLNGGMMERVNYFADPPEYYLNIFDFSGIIMAAVYSVVLYVVGVFSAKKRKNEIAGTYGKAKVMTEIVAAVSGLYAFTIALNLTALVRIYGNGNFGTFFICCLFFVGTTVIFKLIFSAKRKEAIRQSLNHFPAYAAVLGAITLVYALGFFGYSGYVPKAEKVDEVVVCTNLYKDGDRNMAGDSVYGLKDMTLEEFSYYHTDSDSITYTSADDIDIITKLHKAIIADGKIKDSASNACGAPIYIEYTLKNGKVVVREYAETTLETVKKMMALNELKAAKAGLEKSFEHAENESDTLEYLSDYISDIIGKKVTLDKDSNEVYNENNEVIGWIAYEADGIKYVPYDGSMIYIEGYEDFSRSSDTGFVQIFDDNCYLYPLDMTKGYNIGSADSELFNAIKTDFMNLTTEQYFMHKPEDEIGILSFGLSFTENRDNYYGYGGSEVLTTMAEYYYDDTSAVPEEVPVEEPVNKGEYAEGTSWNLNSGDIKAIVVTKDMKNTVKYLESHDMMKYFTSSRKVQDIKAVKLATPGELFGKTRLSRNYPVFYGAYWDSESVGLFDDLGRENEHCFKKINNEITDVERITKLLDGSLAFGLCDKDYRIMEITYNDGSIATVLVPYETYKTVLGKILSEESFSDSSLFPMGLTLTA